MIYLLPRGGELLPYYIINYIHPSIPFFLSSSPPPSQLKLLVRAASSTAEGGQELQTHQPGADHEGQAGPAREARRIRFRVVRTVVDPRVCRGGWVLRVLYHVIDDTHTHIHALTYLIIIIMCIYKLYVYSNLCTA